MKIISLNVHTLRVFIQLPYTHSHFLTYLDSRLLRGLGGVLNSTSSANSFPSLDFAGLHNSLFHTMECVGIVYHHMHALACPPKSRQILKMVLQVWTWTYPCFILCTSILATFPPPPPSRWNPTGELAIVLEKQVLISLSLTLPMLESLMIVSLVGYEGKLQCPTIWRGALITDDKLIKSSGDLECLTRTCIKHPLTEFLHLFCSHIHLSKCYSIHPAFVSHIQCHQKIVILDMTHTNMLWSITACG